MIHLNILKSNDPNAAGLYEFQYDVLSIGKNLHNDLILKEDEIPKTIGFLIIENRSLFIQTLNSNFFCFVNGKKLSGKKRLEINDKLQIGQTIIEVTQFQKTAEEFVFADLYKNFLAKYPDHTYILEALDSEIEEIENS